MRTWPFAFTLLLALPSVLSQACPNLQTSPKHVLVPHGGAFDLHISTFSYQARVSVCGPSPLSLTGTSVVESGIIRVAATSAAGLYPLSLTATVEGTDCTVEATLMVEILPDPCDTTTASCTVSSGQCQDTTTKSIVLPPGPARSAVTTAYVNFYHPLGATFTCPPNTNVEGRSCKFPPAYSCRQWFLERTHDRADGIKYMDGLDAHMYCSFYEEGGPSGSIFVFDGNLQTPNTVDSRQCVLLHSIDDNDMNVMWDDFSVRQACDDSDSNPFSVNFMQRNRDGTETNHCSSGGARLPAPATVVASNARPIPFPGSGITVWADPSNNRFIYKDRSGVDRIILFADVQAHNQSEWDQWRNGGHAFGSSESSRRFYINDGVSTVHIGRTDTANKDFSHVVEFNFGNHTARAWGQSGGVKPMGAFPEADQGTEEDLFGNMIWTVNGRMAVYAGQTTNTFKMRLGGSMFNPNIKTGDPLVEFTGCTTGSVDDLGVDIFMRVNSDGTLVVGDWGHDNGGLFDCGNDNQMGECRVPSIKLAQKNMPYTPLPRPSTCQQLYEQDNSLQSGYYVVISGMVYCEFHGGKGSTSMFVFSGAFSGSNPADSRACVLDNSNDDNDGSIMWDDFSVRVSCGNYRTMELGHYYSARDRTGTDSVTCSSSTHMPSRPSSVTGVYARPFPFPLSGITVWADQENSRFQYLTADGVTHTILYSAVATTDSTAWNNWIANNEFATTSYGNRFVISDGVATVHVGTWSAPSNAYAHVIEFNFIDHTARAFSSSSGVVPWTSRPNPSWNTEEDPFSDFLWTVNGRVVYFAAQDSTGFTLKMGGTIWNPGDVSTPHQTMQFSGCLTSSPSQPGLDIFARVNLDGTLVVGDWGHDNGGLFGCGNDNQFGECRVPSITLAASGPVTAFPVFDP